MHHVFDVKRRFGWFLGLALVVGSAHAATVTDGALSVNIESNGQFNVIVLNSEPIDTSSYAQEYEGATCSGFGSGSTVTVSGSTATYSATCAGFDVSVTSDILGPLASNPATTNVLRQSITYTNNSGGPLALESVSDFDQDLASTSSNDVVEYDSAAQTVFATDSVDGASGTHFAAMRATTDCPSSTFGWDVDSLGSESTSFPMDNGTGPVGPGDTAMSIGYDCGSIANGESVTVTYEYLFSTDLSSVPSDFGQAAEAHTIPTLSPWALITLILLVVGMGMLLPAARR